MGTTTTRLTQQPQSRTFIDDAICRLLESCSRYQLDSDSELARRLEELKKRAASNEIVLTVLGEFDAGKTTFINKILGTDILKTGLLPTTSVCTYIRYGKSVACEVFLKTGKVLALSPEQVGQYSTDGEHRSQVTSVRVTLPASLLADGLVVVDTPGVNVNISAHEAITEQAISEANACLFLMDARVPGAKTTVDFLRSISGRIDKFFFVLNKADILDLGEQQEALEYVSNVLMQECGIPNPRVLLLSSTFKEDSLEWGERFTSFERDLRNFMKAERDLVICAELARSLDHAVGRAELLLASKYRLAERELAEHYKISLPDGADIVHALRKEVQEEIDRDLEQLRQDFCKAHLVVCKRLRAEVEGIVSSAESTEELVKGAPSRITKTFGEHKQTLDELVSTSLERFFSTRQQQIVATVNQLFSGVQWLEQRTFFLRPALWVSLVIGLVAVPLFEYRLAVPSTALLISPVLGLSAAAVSYGIVYWYRSRSRFALAAMQSNIYERIAHEAISSGKRYRAAVSGPDTLSEAFGQLWGWVTGGNVRGLKKEIRNNLKPVLDNFESTTITVGLSAISGAKTSLTEMISKCTDRYGIILEHLLKPQRKIRAAIESRQQAIQSDVIFLRNTRGKLPDYYEQLQEQLKGFSNPYASRTAEETSPPATSLELSIASAAPGTDTANPVTLVDVGVAARQPRSKLLAVGWVTCLFLFLSSLLGTAGMVGGLDTFLPSGLRQADEHRTLQATVPPKFDSKQSAQLQTPPVEALEPSTKDAIVAPRLESIIAILQRADSQPEVSIPEQYWRDTGITPTDKERTETSATALRLSDSRVPELAVYDCNPDYSGSSGCPMNIYGLRSEVIGDGRVSLKYKSLLEGPNGGSIHVLDSMTNSYRDLLVDGNWGASVLKFDGTLYKATECFSHDYKKLDDIHPSDCQSVGPSVAQPRDDAKLSNSVLAPAAPTPSTTTVESAKPVEPNPKPAPAEKNQGSDQLYIDSHVSLQNECSKVNISVALRYDSPQGWITRGWFVAKPSEEKSLALPSLRRNSIIYFYAQGGGMRWDGQKDSQAYNADVVDQVFVYHDGESVQGSNKRTVSMFSRQGTDNPSLRFGCPTGVPGEDRSSSAGMWTDPATGLIWTAMDNGRDVNWNEATNYCKNLSLGGYSNWQLPKIDELQHIYQGVYIHYSGGITQFDYKKLSVPYHIKGGIVLTGNQWSATQNNSNGYGSAYVLFLDGARNLGLFNGSHNLRALCVRRSRE
jgi:ribosome biogenesis GTPase A